MGVKELTSHCILIRVDSTLVHTETSYRLLPGAGSLRDIGIGQLSTLPKVSSPVPSPRFPRQQGRISTIGLNRFAVGPKASASSVCQDNCNRDTRAVT